MRHVLVVHHTAQDTRKIAAIHEVPEDRMFPARLKEAADLPEIEGFEVRVAPGASFYEVQEELRRAAHERGYTFAGVWYGGIIEVERFRPPAPRVAPDAHHPLSDLVQAIDTVRDGVADMRQLHAAIITARGRGFTWTLTEGLPGQFLAVARDSGGGQRHGVAGSPGRALAQAVESFGKEKGQVR